MLADEVSFVLGVDTHADAHALMLLDVASQQARRSLTVPATRRGYRQALRLARRDAPGRRAWALEGSGSYGAGLARFLSERGECTDPTTRNYIARRVSEGKSERDAVRCLKRYLARSLFRQLEATQKTP